MAKKFLTIIIALFVVLSGIPVGVSAEETTEEETLVEMIKETPDPELPHEELPLEMAETNAADEERSMEGEAYSVITVDGNLIFFRSNDTYENDGEECVAKDIFGNEYTGIVFSQFEQGLTFSSPWESQKSNIKSITVAAGQLIKPESMNSWFAQLSNCTSIDLTGFDTSNVTDMSDMFFDCSNLTSLDISGFDTSNVTRMANMFYNCSSLTSLDISNFNTSSVFDMSYMFDDCDGLTSLDLSGFDTNNVTDMSYMFRYCDKLTSLDLSEFDTSNVVTMKWMFFGCSSLTNLDVSSFDTGNVEIMSGMFYGCGSLTSLDLSGFETSKVSDMGALLSGCTNLTSLDISGFDTSNVTDMAIMFGGCSSLTSLDISNFDTSNVMDMMEMFSGCSSLTSLDISGFDTSNVTDMATMFGECSSLTSLDLRSFVTSRVTDMNSMFSGCSGLTSLDLSSFETSKVTDMNSMFSGCSSLTSLDLSCLETSKVTDMSYMFTNCSSLANLDLSDFETSKVTDMTEMFSGCSSLLKLDVSSFNTENVTSMAWLFQGCEGLETLDLSMWNTSNVETMCRMFLECTKLRSVNLSGFDTSKVTSMLGMFEECNSLSTLDVSDFDTSNVNDFGEMFCGCSSLKRIDVSNFNTSKVTNMTFMFNECSSLKSIDLSNFDTSKVIDMQNLFYNCSQLRSLDLSGLNTSNVRTMQGAFAYCSSLTRLDLSNLNISQLIDISYLFYKCTKLSTINLSCFEKNNVRYMYGTFAYCSGLTSLDLSSFDTSKVTEMRNLFYKCNNLSSLNLSGFDTGNCEYMQDMFDECSSLSNLCLGSKFTRWTNDTHLPVGMWTNNGIGISLSETELSEQYPSHSNEWMGWWQWSARDPSPAPTPTPTVSNRSAIEQFNYLPKSYSSELAKYCAKYTALIYPNYHYDSEQDYFYSADDSGIYYIEKYLFDDGFDYPKLYLENAHEEDGVTFALAHKKVMHNSEERDLLFVIIQGTIGKQWYGNFNIEKPQFNPFIDKETADAYSFLHGTNIVQKAIKEYINNPDNNPAGVSPNKLNQPLVLITGHSRGAAIGNLLAANLSAGDISSIDKTKVYAYLFAVPNTTTQRNSVLGNIFNFCFEDDFVTSLPLGVWKYKRHGVDYTAIAEEAYSDNIKFRISENRSLRNSSKTGFDDENSMRFNQEKCSKTIEVVGDEDHWHTVKDYYLGFPEDQRDYPLFDFMYNSIAPIAAEEAGYVTQGVVALQQCMWTPYGIVARFFADGLHPRYSFGNTHAMYTYYNAIKTGVFDDEDAKKQSASNSVFSPVLIKTDTVLTTSESTEENKTYLYEELESLNQFANFEDNISLLGWNLDDPTTWNGITFENMRVTEISLYSYGLTGKLDLSAFSSLRKIGVSGNQISELILPDSSISVLDQLDCSYNNLKELDLSGQLLDALDCSDNYLDISVIEESIEGIPSVSYIPQKISADAIFSDDDITALKTILTNKDIWDLNADFKNWWGVTWNETDGIYRVVALDIANCGLSGSLNVSELPYLKRLECNGNELTSLVADGCNSLNYLNCCNNKLTVLSLNSVSDELSLFCDNNYLDLNDLEEIKTSVLSKNNQKVVSNVSDFNTSEYSVLKETANILGMDEGKPGDWDFVQWKKIDGEYRVIELHCYDQEDFVTSLDLSTFDYLERISLSATGLKEVTLPEKMTKLNEYSFNGCRQLEKVELPLGLVEIGEGAFEKCESLKTINIPKATTNVRAYAFNECNSLTDVNYDGSASSWKIIEIETANDPLINAAIHYGEETENPTSVSIDGSHEVLAGNTIKLIVTVIPANVEQSVIWTSSDETIATVDQTGLVTGIKPGNAAITATTSNGLTATCNVRVLFTDVAISSQYYFNPVYWAVDNEITVGAGGPGKFSPNASCTREQFVTFLWRQQGKPSYEKGCDFSDVPTDAWYYEPISWAAENGITTGLNDGTGRFGVGQACTREQCVTFLHRAADTPEPEGSIEFTDSQEGRYYYKAIKWAAGKGITVGLNDGTGRFGVGQKCTRGMLVTFLYRYANAE